MWIVKPFHQSLPHFALTTRLSSFGTLSFDYCIDIIFGILPRQNYIQVFSVSLISPSFLSGLGAYFHFYDKQDSRFRRDLGVLGYAVEVILLATWNNGQELESIGDQMLQGR